MADINEEEPALASRLDAVKALEPLINSSGYEFSDESSLSVLIGSSNGVKLGFTPIENIDASFIPDASSKFGQAVASSLAAVTAFSVTAASEFTLRRVDLSVTGIGFDIPAVTSTLCFVEGASDLVSKPDTTTSGQSDAGDDESAQPSTWWSSITSTASSVVSASYNWTKEQISSLFQFGAKSALAIGTNVASIKPDLVKFGFTTPEDGFFSVTIGTYVGASLKFIPVETEEAVVRPDTTNYNMFQRGLVKSLESVRAAALKVTGDKAFSIAQIELRITKLGLNIPEVSATVVLRDNRDGSVEKNIEMKTFASELEEGEIAPEVLPVDTQVTSQLATVGHKLQDLGVKAANNTKVATRKAMEQLNVQLNEPDWCSVLVGTANGSTLSLRPLGGEADIEGAEATMKQDNQGELTRVQKLLLTTSRYLKANADALHSRDLEVQQLDVEVSGLGLAIPRAFTTIVLRKKIADPKE